MKFIFILIISCFTFLYSNNHKLKILIENDVLEDYQKLVKDKNPLKINNFKDKYSRRSTVEIILLQQALHKGGYKSEFEFITTPTYERKLVQLKQGVAFMSGTSIWSYNLEEMKKNLFISDALIRQNEFEAGLYTIESNKKALSSKSLEDIQKLTAISNKYWIPDWKTLENLKLKKLINTTKWKFIVRMVDAKRGDFLLAPFQSTKDLSFISEGVKLIPIQNLKVGLNGSRHFGISKNYKNSKVIFEALNKGIKILRKEGIIKKAYEESGFFNEKVKHWKKLN